MIDTGLGFIFDGIVTVISVLGLSFGVAVAVFKFLAKNWIKNKFAEQLAAFKHKQDVEIQRLRIEIDSTLSGVLKIQEKEYETLTEAWSLLDEAIKWVANVISPYQQYPDLDRKSVLEVEEILGNTELLESQKFKIKNSRTKSTTFIEETYWLRIHKVKIVVSDLETYVIRHGIFFPADIKAKFDLVIPQLKDAYGDYELGREMKDFEIQGKGWDKLTKECNIIRDQIEIAIHSRLRSHGSLM